MTTSVVVWKWRDKLHERGSDFKAEYYNILYSMLARNITVPWRMVCVTDDTNGLRPEIQAVPDLTNMSHARSPHGEAFPSCYRRLWNFSPEAKAILGDRILAMDVDVIITGNIDHLLTREEDFVGWTDPQFKWNKIAGGLYFHRTGTLPHIWTEFDPVRSPAVTKQAGCFGSDQGWLSYKLFPPRASFGRKEGVYYLKWLHNDNTPPPEHVRIVSTPGEMKPWLHQTHKRFKWISEYWKS